jgi:hypothetical protein
MDGDCLLSGAAGGEHDGEKKGGYFFIITIFARTREKSTLNIWIL